MTKNHPSLTYSYDPDLTDLLKAEHQELWVDCDLVFKHIKDKDFTQLNDVFKQFSSLVKVHWTNERKMYAHLNFVTSKNDGRYRDTCKEMRSIASSISSTINLYTNMPINDKNLNAFKKDFAILAKALIGRIRYEEKYLFKEYDEYQSS